MQSFVENLAVVCFVLIVLGLVVLVTVDHRRHRRLSAISFVVAPVALVVLAVLSLAGAGATEAKCETKGGSWVEKASAVVYGRTGSETVTSYGCVYPMVPPTTTVAGPRR